MFIIGVLGQSQLGQQEEELSWDRQTHDCLVQGCKLVYWFRDTLNIQESPNIVSSQTDSEINHVLRTQSSNNNNIALPSCIQYYICSDLGGICVVIQIFMFCNPSLGRIFLHIISGFWIMDICEWSIRCFGSWICEFKWLN